MMELFPGGGAGVVVLTAEDFEAKVMASKETWLVEVRPCTGWGVGAARGLPVCGRQAGQLLDSDWTATA